MKKLLLILLILNGCISTERSTYRAVGVTQVSVETALKAWDKWVEMDKATVEQEKKVKAAYEKYQIAALNVVTVAQKYSMDKDKLSLDEAIAVASGALNELVNLITSYGVKL